ncbi:hypothetical protein SteCoe_1701 [Stentor coeruleus]|uniref:Tyrosine-protein kinase ephrin type A/B receptor-like domain-containing protein n=1 Tax=Stentor coeruleus TaxID=5963 RepID=A0A1R2D1A7_9CILI|nr:hypothetical protein SteCoe_1701 [Stentor coeruleus]
MIFASLKTIILASVIILASTIEYSHLPLSKLGPRARKFSSLAFNSENNTVFLFGGEGDNQNDDLWLYNTEVRKWEYLNVFSDTPGMKNIGKRYQAGIFFRNRNSELCVYGGRDDKKIYSDVFCYRLLTMSWVYQKTINTPGLLYKFAFCNYEDSGSEFFAVAGFSIFTSELEVYILDIKTWVWTRIPMDYDRVIMEVQFDLTQTQILMTYINGTLIIPIFSHDINSQFVVILNLSSLSMKKASNIIPNYLGGLPNPLSLSYINSTFIIIFESGLILHSTFSYTEFIWYSSATSFPTNQKASVSCYKNHCFSFGGIKDNILINSLEQWYIHDQYNITINILYDNYLSPQPRISHTMNTIHGDIIMFGGRDKTTFYNDLWKYNTKKGLWNTMKPEGYPPSPRADFGSDVEGDAFFIWGGEDQNGYKNDIFVYNGYNDVWNFIESKSNVLPSKRKNACIVAVMPVLYIFGGVDEDGPCEDLWAFHFSNLTYTKIKDIEPIEKPSCFLKDSSDLIIIGGNSVIYFSLRMLKKITSIIHIPIESTIIQMKDFYVFIGGLGFSKGSYSPLIQSYGLNEDFTLKLPEPLHKSASVYHSKSLYIFSGQGYTQSFYPIPSLSPNPRFAKLNLHDLCINKSCTISCSKGFSSQNQSCVICPEGTFWNYIDTIKCEPCAPGFFNPFQGGTSILQCYPCPEGTFSSKPGAKMCKICSPEDYCPVASISPIKNTHSPRQQTMDTEKIVFKNQYRPYPYWPLTYAILIGIIILSLLCVCIPKMRDKIRKIDIFSHYHNCKEGEYIKITKNILGAFVTLLYIACAVLIAGIISSCFILNNEEEIKSLIPTELLMGQQSKTNFKFDIYLKDFPSICEKFINQYDDLPYVDPDDQYPNKNKCNGNFELTVQGITKNKDQMRCLNIYQRTCHIIYECKGCQINKDASVEIDINERLVYTTGISVNLTFESDYRNENTQAFSEINIGKGKVLIGSEPSEFKFTLIPSYFYSETSNDAGYRGYYISQDVQTKPGSKNPIENMPFNFHVGIKISLAKMDNALVTHIRYRHSRIMILSLLIGALAGLFNLFGSSLSYFELWRLLKNKNNTQTRNFNYIRSQNEALSEMHFHELVVENSARNEENISPSK